MTKVERLVERIRESGCEVPEGYEFNRTYAGRVQRESGAWSWFIQRGQTLPDIGGYWTVTALLAAPSITVTSDRATGMLCVDAGE